MIKKKPEKIIFRETSYRDFFQNKRQLKGALKDPVKVHQLC